jgi:hypothetical protein
VPGAAVAFAILFILRVTAEVTALLDSY